MKKGLLFILVLAGFLYATNPGKEDFEDFIARRIDKEISKETGEDEISEIFEPFAKGLARLGAAVGATFARRDNYYLFSIYTFELPAGEQEGEVRWRYLGIGGQFIPLQQGDEVNASR